MNTEVEVYSERNKTSRGITLSGLLNAIDGVSAYEGRVIIPALNHSGYRLSVIGAICNPIACVNAASGSV